MTGLEPGCCLCFTDKTTRAPLGSGEWGCSSDEEEQALRKEKEDAKRKETMVRGGVDRRVAVH